MHTLWSRDVGGPLPNDTRIIMLPWKHPLFVVLLAVLRDPDGAANAQNAPLVLHHLYEVASDGTEDLVVSLQGYDLNGDVTSATITRLPASGALFQLSRVFDDHGHGPKAGVPIASLPAAVVGGASRAVYRRPRDRGRVGGRGRGGRDADEFGYATDDGNGGGRSAARTVMLVSDPKIHLIVISVVVNRLAVTVAQMQKYNIFLYQPSNKPLPTSLSACF